jgi:hypothetical protein
MKTDRLVIKDLLDSNRIVVSPSQGGAVIISTEWEDYGQGQPDPEDGIAAVGVLLSLDDAKRLRAYLDARIAEMEGAQ